MDEIENTLFTKAAFDDLKETGFTVEEYSKVRYYGKVTIDGKTFDAVDMLETLEIIGVSGYYLSNTNMVAVLKKYGVLKYEGNNRWGASSEAGPNLEAFTKMLKAKIEAFENSDNWLEA